MITFKIAFNLAVLVFQLYLVGRGLVVMQAAGPVAGGAFLLVTMLANLIKFGPD